MNSKERVFATVAGQATDRRACSFTASLYGAALIECNVREYYNVPDYYIEGQLAVAENLCTDIIFSPFAFPLFAETAGAGLRYFDNSPPNVSTPVGYDPEKGFDFTVEKMLEHKNTQNPLLVVKTLAKELEDKVIAGIAPSPCDLPAVIFGIDKWLHTLLFYPENAKLIIRSLSKYFLAISNQMFENGATVVVMTINFLNSSIVTTNIKEQIVFPILKETLAQVTGSLVIHHGGPDFGSNLKTFDELPNVLAYVISPKDNFEKSRQQVSKERILLGNYDGPDLVNHNASEIKKRVNKILEQTRNDRHFIFGSSNADISYETPLENLKIIEETIKNFKI